jgi:hypothetical protein
VPVVGMLMVAAGPNETIVQALRDGLRELGYVEGRDFRFEHRTAEGVRRAKAALSSGCKAHPATAPAGSNRSSHGGNEMAEAFG